MTDFGDDKLNRQQREMFENRMELLNEMGDTESINELIHDILDMGSMQDKEVQNSIFGDTALNYGVSLRIKLRKARNDLILKTQVIKAAGDLRDKSSEYRFLYKDVATADEMEEIRCEKVREKRSATYAKPSYAT